MGQITTGLANGGATAYYSVSYDDSLSPQFGLDIAQGLIANCDEDYKLMSTWFANPIPYDLPIPVGLVNSSAGGAWGNIGGFSVGLGMAPGGYPFTPDANFARYLLVAEVSEMFMMGMGDTWTEGSGGDEGSKGEALSRFLGNQFKLANGISERYPDFEVVKEWFNLQSRPDTAVTIAPDDTGVDSVVGCAMCFLYFLHDHLDFSIPQIINAGAATLAGVFTKLTGRTDAFNEFVGVLKNHYPQSLSPPVAGVPAFISYTIPGDDVFPVANLTGFVSSSLGAPSLDAGSTGTPVVLGLDRITPLDIIVELSSDDPALLSVPASVTIPAGNNSAGTVFAQPAIEVAAAPVPGPARTVAIHATYAGKTVTATVVITPPSSVLQGHVLDPNGIGIDDATVLLQSNVAISSIAGNTLQLSTDQTGAYNTGVIPAGTYQVSVMAGGYVSQTVPVTIGEGVPVTIRDFKLVVPLPYVVEGTIYGKGGIGLAGAIVTLGGLSTTTNSAGGYEISGNPGSYAGQYTLTASAPGYAPNSMFFSIPNGATLTGENLTLAALGSLTGVVADSGTQQPIAGAIVWAGAASTSSDASGHYSIASIPPGVITVKVTAKGYDAAALPITISPGVQTTLDFHMKAGTATITGTVTDDNFGNPIANATVACSAGLATTQADGSYTLTGLPAGSLQVTASAKHHTASSALVQLADHQTLSLDFSLGSALKTPHQPQPV